MSSSEDGTVRIWDLRTGRETAVLSHPGVVNAVARAPDFRTIVTGDSDGCVRIRDIATGHESRTLSEHGGRMHALAVTGDGRLAITGSEDGLVRLWDLDGGRMWRKLGRHDGPITAIALLPDNRRVVTGSADRTLRVWHLIDRTVRVLEGHEGPITSVAASPDGRHLTSSAGRDREALVWDVGLLGPIRSLSCETPLDRPTCVAFAPDGKSVVGGSETGFVHVWNLEGPQEPGVLGGALYRVERGGRLRRAAEEEKGDEGGLQRVGREAHTSHVTALTVAPDGQTVLSGAYDGTLKHWNLLADGSGAPDERMFDAFALAVSPQWAQAVTGSEDDSGLKVFDMGSGQLLAELEALDEAGADVRALAISPDAGNVFAGLESGSIWWFTSEAAHGGDGEMLGSAGHHELTVSVLAVSGDGLYLLSGSEDETLKVWDLDDGAAEVAELSASSEPTALAITADGQYAVSGDGSGEITVWDVGEGWEEGYLEGHRGRILAIKVLGDGDRIVSICARGILKTWDPETWTELSSLSLHRSIVAADVTPCGRFLVTASRGARLAVWDLDAEEPIASFAGQAPIHTVGISADGEHVAVGEVTGRGHFLEVMRVS